MREHAIPAVPQLHPDHIEPIASVKLGAVWRVRTPHSADDLLSPGFFDRVASHGLRRDDLLIVTTDTGQEKHGHVVVAVERVDHGHVT
jgi:hypothetical protein